MKLWLSLLLLFGHFISNGQMDTKITSNKRYFSKDKIWRYNSAYIKSNSVKNIKEFLQSADTLILISEYTFNKNGFLTNVKNYDIHGKHTGSSQWILSASGKILEHKYFDGKEWKTLNHKSKINQEEIATEDSTVRHIQKGRTVKDIKYNSDGSLKYVTKRIFNKDSLVVKEVYDRRASIKKTDNRKARKSHLHVPQPVRYFKRIYKYSKDGRLKQIKEFYNPLIPLNKRNFTYSTEGLLIKMERVRKRMPDQTWIYKITKH